MKRILIYSVLSFLFFQGVYGQDSLTINQAIEIALANNFDIKLSENKLSQADNNQAILNSGYLPSLTGAANGSYSNQSAYVVSQLGNENTINGVETKAYGGSLALNYVLFNGKRQLNYQNFKKAYELADVQRKIQINNTVQDVYIAYYNLAKSINQQDILMKSLAISEERYERVAFQFEKGQKSSLEVLNARVDVNRDSLNIANSNVVIGNFRRNLNYLLGLEIKREFSITGSVELGGILLYDELMQQMLTNNSQLKQIEVNQSMSALALKINQSNWLPSVSANASYGFNNNDFGPVSFNSIQNTRGLTSGINLSWNIFDGGSTQIKVNNAKIDIHNQQITKDQLSLSLENQLATIWADYNNQLFVIKSEKLNVDVNNQNFLKTKEQYHLGLLNSLDFRQAQINLINAKLNLSNAQFDAKIAELKLKRLAEVLISSL